MILKIFGFFFHCAKRVINRCLRAYYTTSFSVVGKDVYIGPHGTFHFNRIEIGNDVYIGRNACFQSSYGKIVIGNHVMFGPNVHIHGGNHKINQVGMYMKAVQDKKWETMGL